MQEGFWLISKKDKTREISHKGREITQGFKEKNLVFFHAMCYNSKVYLQFKQTNQITPKKGKGESPCVIAFHSFFALVLHFIM